MKKNKVILIYVLLLLVLIGCKKEENPSNFKPKDKAPESLTKVSSGIDEILKSVSDIERLALNIPLPKKEEAAAQKQDPNATPSGGSQGSQGDQKQQGQESKSSGGEQSGGSQESKGQEADKSKEDLKQEEIKKSWDKIQNKLDEIHPQWNTFEAEGQKKGATKEAEDKFETAFNKMTKSIEDKKIIEIYDYASQSLANLKPLFDLYLDEVGGDISILKYAAYKGYTEAIQGDLEAAKKVLSDREENINIIRLKMTEEDEKQKVEKVSLSLVDFKDSLAENSRMLFMIKKDIIIENLKALEK